MATGGGGEILAIKENTQTKKKNQGHSYNSFHG